MDKYKGELFAFVRSPPVKDTNNTEERALRPRVVKWKISSRATKILPRSVVFGELGVHRLCRKSKG
ncbi:hypothetical protein KGY64_05675 [Candidatus Bipolaricaulota bacterium]|nr:hypothetical protein [Candidatus Bipolaricaulota bacterium]